MQFWYNRDYLENILSRERSHFFYILYIHDTHTFDESKVFLSLLFLIAIQTFIKKNQKYKKQKIGNKKEVE